MPVLRPPLLLLLLSALAGCSEDPPGAGAPPDHTGDTGELAPPGDWESVSVEGFASCGIRAGNALSCWGRYPEELDELGGVLQVAVGGDHVCVLEPDASAACF